MNIKTIAFMIILSVFGCTQNIFSSYDSDNSSGSSGSIETLLNKAQNKIPSLEAGDANVTNNILPELRRSLAITKNPNATEEELKSVRADTTPKISEIMLMRDFDHKDALTTATLAMYKEANQRIANGKYSESQSDAKMSSDTTSYDNYDHKDAK